MSKRTWVDLQVGDELVCTVQGQRSIVRVVRTTKTRLVLDNEDSLMRATGNVVRFGWEPGHYSLEGIEEVRASQTLKRYLVHARAKLDMLLSTCPDIETAQRLVAAAEAVAVSAADRTSI